AGCRIQDNATRTSNNSRPPPASVANHQLAIAMPLMDRPSSSRTALLGRLALGDGPEGPSYNAAPADKELSTTRNKDADRATEATQDRAVEQRSDRGPRLRQGESLERFLFALAQHHHVHRRVGLDVAQLADELAHIVGHILVTNFQQDV